MLKSLNLQALMVYDHTNLELSFRARLGRGLVWAPRLHVLKLNKIIIYLVIVFKQVLNLRASY